MAGALTHTVIALFCAYLVYHQHYRTEFSLAIFVGNFVPDVIKFGISAIAQGRMNILAIEHDWLYDLLNTMSSDPVNWFLLGLFLVSLTLLLYHFHIIKEKTMKEYDELYMFLVIGIVVHLVLDVLVIEVNPWI